MRHNISLPLSLAFSSLLMLMLAIMLTSAKASLTYRSPETSIGNPTGERVLGSLSTNLTRTDNPSEPDSFVDTGDWSQYLSADNTHTVAVVSTSTVWTLGAGLVKWTTTEPTTYTQYLRADPVQARAGLASNWTSSLVEDGAGGLWVGTDNGLSHLTSTGWVTYTISNSGLVYPVIYGLARASDNTLWIATNGGGANHFDPASNTWITYTTANSGLPSNRLFSVAIDGTGTMWTTDYGGSHLTSFNGTTWHIYEPEDIGFRSTASIVSMTIDHQGALTVGAVPGIARRTGQGWTVIDRDQHPAWDITYDSTGNLWTTNRRYIERYDGSTWTRLDPPDPYASSDNCVCVYTLEFGPDGLLWVGTGIGLYSYDPSSGYWRTFRASDFPTGMPANGYSNIMLQDSQGYPWFLLTGPNPYERGGALARLDPNAHVWTKYTVQNSGLITNALRSMALDSHDHFWIGTAQGLQKFDRTTWITYTTTNSGLPGNWVGAVIVDTADNVWVATGDAVSNQAFGITRFDGNTWTTYNTQNSPLPSNGIGTLWADPRGPIWFSGPYGGQAFIGRFDGQNWRIWMPGDNGWWDRVTNYVYTKFALDRNGILWVGSSSGAGLRRLDGNSWTYFNRTNSGMPGNDAANVAVDNSGIEKWVGFFRGSDPYDRPYAGVSVFNDTQWKSYTGDNSPMSFVTGWDIMFDCRSVWILGAEVNRLKLSPFSDVSMRDYFFNPMQELYCRKVISGYADGTFRPGNSTTRAQLCKIVVLARDWTLECPQTGHFSDVPPTDPFYCFIETAYSHGVLNGYADGTFRPGNNVTRGQLCKIIVLAMGWTAQCPTSGHFSDVPPDSPFYCFVEAAYERGVISGYADGTFKPGNSATRGQISKIVYQAITVP